MEVSILFATPIGKFDASNFLEGANKIFENTNLDTTPDGYLTSLKYYNSEKSFAEELSEVSDLKKFIVQCTKEYANEIGYDIKNYDVTVKNIWVNSMVKNQNHRSHQHYGSFFSGCFYINIPQNSSPIFYLGPLNRIDKNEVDIREYTVFNSPKWTIYPKTGELYIWESYLQHGVEGTDFAGERRCVAFDVTLTKEEQ